MDILLSTGNDLLYPDSEIPESCLEGEYLSRKLLRPVNVGEGSSVTIKADGYIINRRKYPLLGQYGLKAIATLEGIAPLLRIAEGKERTISQKVVKDRFGQTDISGPENEYWPILEKIVPVIPIPSEVVEELIETITLGEEELLRTEEEYNEE